MISHDHPLIEKKEVLENLNVKIYIFLNIFFPFPPNNVTYVPEL